MKTNYSISILEPCYENWSKMNPNKKGRFCQSCSKTVVDFTQMPQQSIEEFLAANSQKKICGRFKVSQLEEIRIEIPRKIIQQQTSFHKLFLLALLIAMGTSLLSCSDQNGNAKKINAVKIVDTLKTESINLPEDSISKVEIDSIKKNTILKKPKLIEKIAPPIPTLKGDIIYVVGDIAPPEIKDSTFVNTNQKDLEKEIVFGHVIEDFPEFKNTPDSLSRSEKKDYLSKNITKVINKNFNVKIAKNLDLKGKQRIFTQFKIDENGLVKNIKVRTSSHPDLEMEAIRVIKLLPQFKPIKQRGKNIAAVYTLPIVFVVED